MSAIYAIRYLLANAAGVIAVVPADRIKAVTLPLNTALPAIVVRQISSVPENRTNTNETNKAHSDRVQVSAIHSDYVTLKSLMVQILAACPNQAGTINGVNVYSIRPDAEGPDLYDQATNTYECSRDFIVRRIA